MDAKSFYSKKKVFVPARPLPNPEVSEDSDLSSDSDESEYLLDSDIESDTEEETDVLESDSEVEQDVTSPSTSPTSAPTPAKKAKNAPLRWRTVPSEKVEVKELSFCGNPPLGKLPIQEPIDYFKDIFGDELIVHIVSESNNYALQIDVNKPLNLHVKNYSSSLAFCL